MTTPSPQIDAAVRYLYEVGQLKLARRTGWWHAGVPAPESVAEHSFRTAVIGFVLAVLEGADPNVTAALCLFHDVAEARTGDIPYVAKEYVTRAPEARVAADQVSGMADAARDAIVGAVSRYEARDTPEARLAKDADHLECVLQAREYEHQGFRDTRPWMESNMAGLQSQTARALAERCLILAPDDWWKTFLAGRPAH